MAAVESVPINQLKNHLKKAKDHLHFLEGKVTLLETAVDEERLEDFADVLSQDSLDTARRFQSLTPATCPAGPDRLEHLKSEAQSEQEQGRQKAAEAKAAVADWGVKTENIDGAALALTMENHRSSELAKMDDVTAKVAEVSGDRHQVRSVEEVLEAEGISTSLSKTSKMEKYEEVKSKREKDWRDTLREVFDGPFALPMGFDSIIAARDQTQAELGQIRGKSEQGRVEVRKIHENLATHLESVKQQQDTCKQWRKNSLLKLQTLVEKSEEDLDAWRKHSVELLDEVSLGEELCMRRTKLSQEEDSVTDKIEEAARVSPATDAALASCSEKAAEWTEDIERASKETGTGLMENAMKPLTLAMEVAEANVHGLSRAVDQTEKQICMTKKELEASENNLKQKMEDFNRGACSQTQLADAKSEVRRQEKSLKQQEEELRKVQGRRDKAQHRSDSSYASLIRMGFSAAKSEISQRGKDQAKTAGTFDMVLVPQDTPTPQVSATGPESTALLPFLQEEIVKIVEEQVSEKMKIQEGYHRFAIDKLERQNQALRQELKALRARDDSDARSDTSTPWEMLEYAGPSQQPLPALEDGPSPL